MPRASRLSLALVLLLALVAIAGSQLASGELSPTGPLQGVSVQAGENSATVNWTVTDVPARVVVEYGVDNRYGVWSETTTVLEARSGQTVLTGLEPDTSYAYHVMAVSPVSRLDATGTFGDMGSVGQPARRDHQRPAGDGDEHPLQDGAGDHGHDQPDDRRRPDLPAARLAPVPGPVPGRHRGRDQRLPRHRVHARPRPG